MNTETETRLRALHLDDSLLKLNPEEEAFLKSETGIQDTDELKMHIAKVQEDAYKVRCCLNRTSTDSNIVFRVRVQVYPYPCIRGFRFTRLKIARMPAYPRIL